MKKISLILLISLFCGEIAFAKMHSVQEIDAIFHQAAAVEGGMSAKGLWVSAQLESSGNANSVNGKYAGLINMGEAEFKKYGAEFGDRMDPLHNLIAANSYIKENSIALKKMLKRQLSEAELYLSIQQGRKGVGDLLSHPAYLAVDIRGREAILGNVPDALREKAKHWTCAEFVRFWVNRFNQIKGV